MAGNQISARLEGDMYQGMFFWKHACRLMMPTSRVSRVDIEHDKATHVDDVAVFYDSPGVDDGGNRISAEYFQVKYHVDRSQSYSSTTLIDPTFINASTSLLQRFKKAFGALRSQNLNFTLNLVSNWSWDQNDALGPFIREADGRLPESFFTDGDRASLGKIRSTWKTHLAFGNESDFHAFLRCLRFQTDHFGRRGFQDSVSTNLQLAGMRPYHSEGRTSPYDSLVQRFITDGTRSFNRDGFIDLCKIENLWGEQKSLPGQRAPAIGVRSFLRFAERMEDHCDRFICASNFFSGRFPKNENHWNGAITHRVIDFFADHDLRTALREKDHKLYLECHGSLAFLTGFELDRKSGAKAWPVQKGVKTDTWIPKGVVEPSWQWKTQTIAESPTGLDFGLALSVTHDVSKDVLGLISRRNQALKKVLNLTVPSGIGAGSISGPDHAISLANQAAIAIRQLRSEIGPGTLHLWFAAPNALAFFLGQHREALGTVQLYEFDFEGSRGGGYAPSINFPIRRP